MDANLCKSRQICLRWHPQQFRHAACCPTVFEQRQNIAAVPEQGAQEGEQTDEDVGPLTAPSQEAQQDIDQERSPDLPLDRVFVVTGEIAEFEGLLDLFEKGFDAPAALSHTSLSRMACVSCARSSNTTWLHE